MLIAAILSGCQLFSDPGSPQYAGPCTETGNPTGISGTVTLPSGAPAPGASVRLYRRLGPDSSASIEPVASAVSCANGSFGFTSVSDGAYALAAFDSIHGTRAWLPKIDTRLTRFPASLVLQPPGGIRGIVTRGPNLRPAGILADEKILVRLIGTEQSLLTDSGGGVSFSGVAVGIYTVLFSAMDGHYLSRRLDSVAVNSGVTSPLPRVTLEWSPFTAPPTPTGLRVVLDSAGFHHVGWRAVTVANLSHYELLRRDTLSARPGDTLVTTDTNLVDSLRGVPPGDTLGYRVRAVNALGNKSPWSEALAARAPVGRDTLGTGTQIVSVLTLQDGLAVGFVFVRLYRIPTAPGSPDSLPLLPALVDSAVSDAQGRAAFRDLPAGRYTLTAEASSSGRKACRVGIAPGADTQTDTLELKLPGLLKGAATRQRLWVSSPFKADENIQVTLAGTPFQTYTDYNGVFRLANLPPGKYQAIIYALPESYFLPDTQTVIISSGDSLELTKVAMAYNPSKPPPAPTGLRVSGSSPGNVTLVWNDIGNYPFLTGYQVSLLDAGSRVLTLSDVTQQTSLSMNIEGYPSGNRIFFVVRALGANGLNGAAGGDSAGKPIAYTVP